MFHPEAEKPILALESITDYITKNMDLFQEESLMVRITT